jgi:hypothetical protein
MGVETVNGEAVGIATGQIFLAPMIDGQRLVEDSPFPEEVLQPGQQFGGRGIQGNFLGRHLSLQFEGFSFKSPFSKGGFRGIFKRLKNPLPPLEKGEK